MREINKPDWWMSDKEVEDFERDQQTLLVEMSNWLMASFEEEGHHKDVWDASNIKYLNSKIAAIKARKAAVQLARNYRMEVLDHGALMNPTMNHTSYDAFFKSQQWQRLRYEVLSKSNMSCELCGASRRNGAELHVDHIEPRSLRPDLELEVDNLQVLCKACNLGKSNLDNTDFRPRVVQIKRGDNEAL